MVTCILSGVEVTQGATLYCSTVDTKLSLVGMLARHLALGTCVVRIVDSALLHARVSDHSRVLRPGLGIILFQTMSPGNMGSARFPGR